MILNHARVTIVLLAWAAALLSIGCAPTTPVALPPINITEYELARDSAAISYPANTILLHNLQRTLSPNLPEDARLSSFRLVEKMGDDSQYVPICLALVLEDKGAPDELRRRVADYLQMRRNEGALVGISPGSRDEPGASR